MKPSLNGAVSSLPRGEVDEVEVEAVATEDVKGMPRMIYLEVVGVMAEGLEGGVVAICNKHIPPYNE